MGWRGESVEVHFLVGVWLLEFKFIILKSPENYKLKDCLLTGCRASFRRMGAGAGYTEKRVV
jgi:hypothetical protein